MIRTSTEKPSAARTPGKYTPNLTFVPVTCAPTSLRSMAMADSVKMTRRERCADFRGNAVGIGGTPGLRHTTGLRVGLHPAPADRARDLRCSDTSRLCSGAAALRRRPRHGSSLHGGRDSCVTEMSRGFG